MGKMYNLNDDERTRPTLHEEDSCGCGSVRTTYLRRMIRPSVFSALMALLLIVEVAAISGYMGAIASTLEREFLLSSYEVGAITIINDATSLTLVGLFTYYGHTSHRPRIIGLGAVLVGVGSVMCAMPHFITEPYSPPTQLDGPTHQLCWETANETMEPDHGASGNSKMSRLYLFIIGQIVVGVGNAPIIPLAMTYVDDAVENYQTSAYVAVIYIGTSVGPIVGFLLSSWTLSLYVDLDVIPVDQWPALSRRDHRWVGAWWLGFLCLGAAMIILALPLFLFPRRLQTNDAVKNRSAEPTRESVELDEAKDNVTREEPAFRSNYDGLNSSSGTIEMTTGHHSHETKKTFQMEKKSRVLRSQPKEYVAALMRLCRNLTLVALALGMSTELAIVSGLTTFGAKYIETQFGLSTGRAAFLTGIAIMPASCVGHILAGFVVRHFKLSAFQCSVFLCVTVLITLLIYPVLIVLGCDTPAVVSPLSSTCVSPCICINTTIDPVCGIDDVTYMSPCLAGCVGSDVQNKTFFDCSCVQSDNRSRGRVSEPPPTAAWDAKESVCPSACTMTEAYLVTSALSLFFMFMGQNPTMLINLRCVDEKDRSFAIGMLTFLAKVFGFFPAPVYFGAVIKSACRLFSSIEGAVVYEYIDSSICWHYDLPVFRRRFLGLMIGLKSCTFIFFLVVMISLYRKGKEEGKTVSKRQQSSSSNTSPSI